MPTNVYFSPKNKQEQFLYEDLVIESLKMYGQDIKYIPRESITVDELLNEDYARFTDAYDIEVYIENTDGFAGEGDLLGKFGLEVRDQATFILSRRRWEQLIGIFNNNINTNRPVEGDLIYLPLSRSMFEIKFVEHEQPFYQLSNLPVFKLECEKFEYSNEKIDTGIADIDNFEASYAASIALDVSFGSRNGVIGEKVYKQFGTDSNGDPIRVTGEIARWERGATSSTVHIVQVGSTDATVREFTAGGNLVSADESGIQWTINTAYGLSTTQTGILNPEDAVADNREFEVEGDSIIDFTETNPFGDPSETF